MKWQCLAKNNRSKFTWSKLELTVKHDNLEWTMFQMRCCGTALKLWNGNCEQPFINIIVLPRRLLDLKRTLNWYPSILWDSPLKLQCILEACNGYKNQYFQACSYVKLTLNLESDFTLGQPSFIHALFHFQSNWAVSFQ